MTIRDYFRLCAEYRFRISRIPMATLNLAGTVVPTLMNPIQKWWYHERAAETELVADPVFVIGHWRSGTTYLHELLSLDDRYATPTTFECFVPRCFLVTQSWLKPLTSYLLPRYRPMDNMDMHWDAPQEDEFALVTMGLPSTYRRIAFPNVPARNLDYVNLQGVPKLELGRWKSGLREFVGYLNYHYRVPLVLKSPAHTGRIRVLMEMFPNAKFIHVTRTPYKFIPSTMHMWSSLDHSNSLQFSRHELMQDFVLDSFERLYGGFNRDRHLLHAGNFVSVRFEDLVSNTLATMGQIYAQLNLGGFSQVRPIIQQTVESKRDYRKNQHSVSPELYEEIDQRCAGYMHQFDYCEKRAAA